MGSSKKPNTEHSGICVPDLQGKDVQIRRKMKTYVLLLCLQEIGKGMYSVAVTNCQC